MALPTAWPQLLVALPVEDVPPNVPRSRIPPEFVHTKACCALLAAVEDEPTTWPEALIAPAEEEAPPSVNSTSPPASVQLKPCCARKSLAVPSEEPTTCPDGLMAFGQA